jgi:nucleoside-diphosphate-sugar epimerase
MKRILILGVNGFVGHHLTRRVLKATDWHVYGMDLQSDRVDAFRNDPRFHFCEGDITINREWVEYNIRKCDVVLPLVAIATPATYVTEPLKVFELDFEANLPIIRHCVKYGVRVIFPSTSEVYGMCRDAAFDPYSSELVLGPINKTRWIYACAKQLLDRVIWSYGATGQLDFTLIRPFNWIGSGLDSVDAPKEGSSRVLTQFLGHIVRGENIQLVDGGAQTRSFTYIDDAIDCLLRIIDNRNGIATGKIYNIGNPANNISIRQLAEMMLGIAMTRPEYRSVARRVRLTDVTANGYYGEGYQDIQTRVPRIDDTCRDFGWAPRTDMRTALNAIFDAYADDLQRVRDLTDTVTVEQVDAIEPGAPQAAALKVS